MPSLRVPLSWLREHVDVRAGVDELAERLHMSGTEVEGIERAGEGWERVWVGRITALEKHPNAERLSLATVGYGEGRTKTVVTGATNLAVGAVVPYAELGARLREGHGEGTFTLEARKVRGIQSEGMVCSARELGVGEDHEGILLLDPGLPVGARLADVFGETVLLLEVQPNRPDVLSIAGVAREVAALYDLALREPAAATLAYAERADALDVRIE
ncbi:MAG: phenylalanine--tRNA ligase subunit beta, partial [Candidatus Limnocylindria bacterium]